MTIKQMMLLFKLFARLPLWWARGIGLALGWLIWALSPTYRRMMRTNFMRACASGRLGPALARQGSAARTVWRQAIGHAGLMATELPKIWCDPAARAKMTVSGIDQVKSIVDQGRGVILLTPHLGAFELSARVISGYFPVTVLYRPSRHVRFRRLMETLRPLPRMATAPASAAGVRQLLRALRQGEAIGMLPDQVPGRGEGRWAPVFGHPAYTMTLPIRLAQATNAVAVWVLAIRTRQGWHLDLQLWSPPMDLASASLDDAVVAMNAALEVQIARAPEQYLWAYNRYKTPRGATVPLSNDACSSSGETN